MSSLKLMPVAAHQFAVQIAVNGSLLLSLLWAMNYWK